MQKKRKREKKNRVLQRSTLIILACSTGEDVVILEVSMRKRNIYPGTWVRSLAVLCGDFLDDRGLEKGRHPAGCMAGGKSILLRARIESTGREACRMEMA